MQPVSDIHTTATDTDPDARTQTRAEEPHARPLAEAARPDAFSRDDPDGVRVPAHPDRTDGSR